MDNSAPNKKPKQQTQFFSKKDSSKRKMVLILPIIFAITPIDDCVIE